MNEFTYDEYKKILFSLSSEGYKFVGYHEPAAPPTCMIRHDLDLSLEKAQRMAMVENELQVKTTYCVMVRTDSYNVFSKKSSLLLASILENGHFLGLHFDCASYPPDTTMEELAEACRVEVRMLENWFGEKVTVVSYHKPNTLVLGGSSEISAPLPHVYERRFMRAVTYLSDSYGFWRFGHPLEHQAFKDKKSLNLGIHPIWWSAASQSSLYSLTLAMEEKREEMRDYMLTNIVGV